MTWLISLMWPQSTWYQVHKDKSKEEQNPLSALLTKRIGDWVQQVNAQWEKKQRILTSGSDLHLIPTLSHSIRANVIQSWYLTGQYHLNKKSLILLIATYWCWCNYILDNLLHLHNLHILSPPLSMTCTLIWVHSSIFSSRSFSYLVYDKVNRS